MIVIGGLIADTHRQPGDAGGDKISERVDPFGYQANTAGKNAGDKFAVASNPLAIIEFLATACFSFCIMLLTFGR
ncbi:hypothetical protein NFX37_15005 [Serratia marcescens]|nr:hypothetical protein NFX37_15005 [Serratia marcescens]